MTPPASFDVAIIGGGIVGLATALAVIDERPGARIIVVEKETRWAAHQSGRNSGVIHAGVSYRPGSLKATMCKLGNVSMMAFCARHAIPYERCGKLIVAVDRRELPALDALVERGRANGVALRRIGPEEIADFEPHVQGVGAVHVPDTGMVDYRRVSETMAGILAARGAQLRLQTRLLRVAPVGRNGARTLETTAGPFAARLVVNCAGLQSDRVTRAAGDEPASRVVAFRGEYYELMAQRRYLVRNLVYPVPDTLFPFLGTHFTRMVDGRVYAGPNAVLAVRREGYRKRGLNLADVRDNLAFSGFRRFVRRQLWRSSSKAAYVRSLQRLIPELSEDDLVRAPAGIRAQAVTADGTLIDDFVIVASERIVHVGNAVSPAATCSLELGREIAHRLYGCGL